MRPIPLDAFRERVCLPVQLKLKCFFGTAGVAQLVERWIVIPVVEGSNPFARPRFSHPITLPCAGVAQLDRASDFGSEG